MSKERLEYNRKILEVIKDQVEAHPDYRFIQLLWALSIVDGQDNFYEESKATYDYLIDAIKENK